MVELIWVRWSRFGTVELMMMIVKFIIGSYLCGFFGLVFQYRPTDTCLSYVTRKCVWKCGIYKKYTVHTFKKIKSRRRRPNLILLFLHFKFQSQWPNSSNHARKRWMGMGRKWYITYYAAIPSLNTRLLYYFMMMKPMTIFF